MKLVKKEGNVLYLICVEPDDKAVLDAVGAKLREDLFYQDHFKFPSYAVPRLCNVVAFELPAAAREEPTPVYISIEEGMLTGVYTEPDTNVTVALYDYDDFACMDEEWPNYSEIKASFDELERRVTNHELVNRY